MKKFYLKHREGILYILFGVVVTAVSWAVYTLCVLLFGLDVTLSNAISWLFAISVAFITNKVFVFCSRSFRIKTVFRELSSFLGSRLITSAVEIFFPTILLNIGINGMLFGIEGFYARLIVNVLVIILNFVFSKLFVFKRKNT